MGDKSKLKLGVYQNPRGDRSKESIKRYTDGFRKKNTRTTITDRGTVRKINLLTGGQAKIAAKAPPPNKIDEKDFAVLRAEKAKGRGMGLQDEKVKPGKVMKANLGLMFMKKAKDKGAKGAEFLSPLAMLKRLSGRKAGGVMKARVGKSIKTGRISDMSFDEKMKRVESGQINKKTGRFTSMNAMRDAKGFQKGETASDFNKRRMKLERAAKVAKSTRLGKILLPVVGAAVAAKTYLNSKMKKDKNKKTLKDFREQKKPGVPSEKTKTINSALNKLKAKKMGGGMMQKPMGYKSGMGPAGAAGPSAGRPGGRRQGPKGGIGSLGKEKKEKIPNIIITKGGAYTYTKPKVDEKKGRHFRQHKSYDASPRLISEAKGKTFSLRSMNVGGMTKPMGYSKGTMVKARGCKLGRTKPTKIT